MAVAEVPYSIRVKKEIDRRLFVETLRMVNKHYDLEKYTYVGMAGPFSEDFKLMYDRFNFRRMFSYETDDTVHERQKFNAPLDLVLYKKGPISNFIDDYPSLLGKSGRILNLDRVVLWLDYTDFDEKIVREFVEAVSKLEDGSVVKVTVQAHASKLGTKSEGETQEQLNDRRVDKCREILGEFFYNDVMKKENMTTMKYPLAVFETLKKAAISKMTGRSSVFVPLTSYIYQDGAKMLTFTGIIIPKGEKTTFLKKTGFKTWKYGLFKNEKPIDIEVGFISMKEKLELDGKALSRTTKKLEYLNEKTKKSYKFLSKFYPTFVRIYQ